MSEIEKLETNLPSLIDESTRVEVFKKIADFQAQCNKEPDKKFIDRTADGKAESLVISYIENRLDEVYSGLWSATKFEYKQILNEIVGTITLKVFHPSCGIWVERDGTAAIEIMMNKDTDFTQLTNKKRNALYLGLPKLKAECLKNAAKSLGITFGRNLNRKKTDGNYEPDIYDSENTETKQEILKLCKTSSLPQAEIDVMKKFAEDEKTGYTRLLGIVERLKNNQK